MKPAYFRSETFRFVPETAFLGEATNGAMPEAATGLIFEAEIGEDCSNFHVLVAKPEHEEGFGEHFMYFSCLEDLEQIFSNICRVAMKGGSTTMTGQYDAFRNRAQIEHSEEASEELYERLTCVINSAKSEHVEVAMMAYGQRRGFRVGSKECVARLSFDMDSKMVTTLSGTFAQLRAFNAKALAARKTASEDLEMDASFAPAMG